MVIHVPGTCMYQFPLEQHLLTAQKNNVCGSSPGESEEKLDKVSVRLSLLL